MATFSKMHNIESVLYNQWMGQMVPPAVLLEQRVLELEGMGLEDIEEIPGVPSSARQFAIASLQHTKPDFFITTDDTLLFARDILEARYGVVILSIQEAMLLLQEGNVPFD